MSERKVNQEQYIQFLIASPDSRSCVEAARVRPQTADAPAHDSFNRLLTDLEPDPDALWREAEGLIDRNVEYALVLDDSTLDKPYARHMELVGWHFSGKHRKVVRGINLVTLLWTDGDRHVPVDFRIYAKGGPTKNELFREMLVAAHARGLSPACVCFDSWYASAENLSLVRRLGWTFLTRLKRNRGVRQGSGRMRLDQADIPEGAGAVVSLTGFGPVRVFRAAADADEECRHWATSDEGMGPLAWRRWSEYSWRIEEYHRGLKQHCGVQRCQARSARAQANHIGMAVRAFLRLSAFCWGRWTTWFGVKTDIIRQAVRAYLAAPYITLDACQDPPHGILPLQRCA
jgi:putative transposase